MSARLTLIPMIAALLLAVAPTVPAGAATPTPPRLKVVVAPRALPPVKAAQVTEPAPPPPPPVTDPSSFIWPIRGKILSPFGFRSGRPHEGIDIDGVTGQPITAAQRGTVSFVGWINGYGNVVKIDHGAGITTLYAHQSRTAAHVGEHLDQGQLLGYVGSTGDASCSHLHYEVIIGGVHRNPAGWLA